MNRTEEEQARFELTMKIIRARGKKGLQIHDPATVFSVEEIIDRWFCCESEFNNYVLSAITHNAYNPYDKHGRDSTYPGYVETDKRIN